MVGLKDNKPLLYCLLATVGLVMFLASGIVPELSESLEVVPFPSDVSLDKVSLHLKTTPNCSYTLYSTMYMLKIL